MIKLKRYSLLAIRDLKTGKVYRKSGGWLLCNCKTWTTASGIITFLKTMIAEKCENTDVAKARHYSAPGSYGWNEKFGTLNQAYKDGLAETLATRQSAGRFFRHTTYASQSA
mgnify:CR=1 FL=1